MHYSMVRANGESPKAVFTTPTASLTLFLPGGKVDVSSGGAFRRQRLGSDPEHVTSHSVKFEKFRRPLRRQPLVLQRELARPAVGLRAISSSCKPDGCRGNETDRLEDVCPASVITIEAENG